MYTHTNTHTHVSLVAQMVYNLSPMQKGLASIPGLVRPLEKEMATHSSILAWRIPWTEEPGGLQSMGSQRVRCNWATNMPPPHTYIRMCVCVCVFVFGVCVSKQLDLCVSDYLQCGTYTNSHMTHIDKTRTLCQVVSHTLFQRFHLWHQAKPWHSDDDRGGPNEDPWSCQKQHMLHVLLWVLSDVQSPPHAVTPALRFL